MNKELFFPFPSQISQTNRNEYDDVLDLVQKKLRQEENKKLKQYEFFNRVLAAGLKIERTKMEKNNEEKTKNNF